MLPSYAHPRSRFSGSLVVLGVALSALILAHPTSAPAQGEMRWALVHRIQQIIRDKVTAIPLFEQAFIWGVGPRVADAGDGRLPGFSYSAPFEELRLK
jgi:ABC-type transport system substrate-binding protein